MGKVHPAMEIAKEKVKSNKNLLGGISEIVIHKSDSKRSDTYGPLAAISMVDRKIADVFFGPNDAYAVSPVVKYCNQWKIPIITTGALVRAYSNKREYKQLTRVQGPYAKVSHFMAMIAEQFSWKLVGILYNDGMRSYSGTSDCYHLMHPTYEHFKELFPKAGHTVDSFDEKRGKDKLKDKVKNLGSKSRGKHGTFISYK